MAWLIVGGIAVLIVVVLISLDRSESLAEPCNIIEYKPRSVVVENRDGNRIEWVTDIGIVWRNKATGFRPSFDYESWLEKNYAADKFRAQQRSKT